MRTPTTILFLAVLLLTQTPVGQVLKLPVLIEHFYKHQRKEGVSLLAFLKDHYSIRHNDTDQAQDEQLPFRNVIVQAIGFALVPGNVKTDFFATFDIPEKFALKDFFVSQQHLCRIFRPPRTQAIN